MQSEQGLLYDQYEVDLMAQCETNNTSLKDIDIEKQKLKQENRMKQKALDKASALIDLLTVELAMSKKSFQETIEDLKNQIVQKQHQQFKLKQHIKSLEQRNNFIEFECKKRITDVKLSRSSSRTSFKSLGKTTSEENYKTVVKGKKNDSYSRLSPPVQKKKVQQKQLSLDYVKSFLQEYINQDYEQNNLINNLVNKENTEYEELKQKLGDSKMYLQFIQGLKAGISRQLQDSIIYKIQSFKNVILDQKSLIENLKRINEQYKSMINQLIEHNQTEFNIHHNNFTILDLIKNINLIFPSKSRQIKDKIVLSANNYVRNSSNQVQKLQQQIKSYSKLTSQIEQIFDVSSQSVMNQQDLIFKIKCLKSNQSRLIQQNRQLITITDGLLKYIKY